jgi:hypothetical protein
VKHFIDDRGSIVTEAIDATVFTAPLDEEAFPPLGETLVLAAARRALRVLLGIDP